MANPDSQNRATIDGPEHALDELLDRLTRSLGATRILLWEAWPVEERLVPVRGPEPLPEAIDDPTSPLFRALREPEPVEVQPAPEWAVAPLVAARVDATRLMTVEGAGSGDVTTAARLLAPALRLHDHHAHAAAAADRADRLVGFLGSLQANATTGRLPDTLLETALAVAGATGGVVASWIGHEGTVMATAGEAGGPMTGVTFPMGEGDLARVAETGAAVHRGPAPDPAEWPPLATSHERWEPVPPAYRSVLPLIEPGGMTTGMLALWSPHPLVDEQGVSLLEALAPVLATQLRTAAELDRLRVQATIDALTGLPNRRALLDRLAEEQARFQRYQRPISLLVVALDLEPVVDALGPAAGDAALRGAAAAIRGVVRKVDYPTRHGRDRLAVLLPETALEPARDVAGRVRAAIDDAPLEYDGQPIDVVASVAVSACPGTAGDPGELVDSAEEALRD